jgi:NAD(P)H-dependent FMN reductase
MESTMKTLAIVGSYRKGRTIDTLVDKAIEGAESAGAEVEKIHLIDQHIEYCRNCMVCRNNDCAPEPAPCPIDDDMQTLYPKLDAAEGLIFGTPVNMGEVTAVMKAFLERCCWTFGKPGTYWGLKGCPMARSPRRKRAISIVSAGLIPPWLRWLCDDATKAIKSMCDTSFGAKLVGTMYAGAVETRGVDRYLDRAYQLGRRVPV